MEHFAHLDAASDELGARRLDVGHDEIEPGCRARRGRRDSLAEVDRARRARRRELHAPERVTDDEVGVEPPAQAAVEALGALDVRNRDDDDLELQVDRRRFRGLDCRFAALFGLSCQSPWVKRSFSVEELTPGRQERLLSRWYRRLPRRRLRS